MNRKQTSILLILGILDLVVIAGLGFIVYTNSQSPAQPEATLSIDPCSQSVLEALPLVTQSSIAWDASQLHLKLYTNYESAAPPEESVQYLWAALDALAYATTQGCPIPATVKVSLTAQGTQQTIHHVAEVEGTYVAAWASGELDEAEFLTYARYRRILDSGP